MSVDDVVQGPDEASPGAAPLTVPQLLPAPLPAASVPLRRTPPQRRLGMVLVMLLAGILPGVGLPLFYFVATDELSMELAAAAVAVVVLLTISWLGWLFALPKPQGVVVDDSVSFGFARRGLVQLALEELVVCRVEKGDLVLVALTADGQVPRGHVGSFVLPRRCFVDVAPRRAGAADGRAAPVGAAAVVAAVRARLATHPHGAALLGRLDDNHARQLAFANRRPWLTWAVTAACVLLFVVEVVSGALEARDPSMLLTLGANAPALVREGQVWRLVTACLLHGSVLHLAMNLSALMSTGALLERWLGRASYAVVLVVTGVVGQLGSAIAFRAPMSVGISGALFGLLGVLLWSTIRYRKTTAAGLKVPLSSWIFLLITNAFLSTLPFVDVVAHGAGFVSGVVAAAALAPRPGRGALLGPRGRVIAAALAGVVVAGALLAGALSAAR